MTSIEKIAARFNIRPPVKESRSITSPAPIVQWVGGKRQLLSRFVEYYPAEFNNYYEPFVGGGAVFFHLFSLGALDKSKVFLSDLNEELITTYNTVAVNHEEVAALLSVLNEKHSKALFYEIRNMDRKKIGEKKYEKIDDIVNLITPVEIAARFIYLNKTCFNALYRVNKDNLFNVPFGNSLRKNVSDNGALALGAQAFRDITIRNVGYDLALKGCGKDDFVYLDPPYEPEPDGNSFTSYTKTGFAFEDQEKLKEKCDWLHSIGAKFMLSNSNVPKILELYKDYDLHTFTVNRTLNSNANKRKSAAKEILVTNF